MPRGELRVGGNEAELPLFLEGDLALLVPAVRELALVLLDPLPGHVVRRVRGAGREVDEERFVGQQRLLLARPGDELVGQIFGEVVALGRRLRRLDRRCAFIQRRVPLVVLAADESVEVLETAAAGRPRGKRPRRARLPHRHLVALAELRGRVAIQLQGERERRFGVGQHRALAGSGGGDLGDAAHPDRVMVAAGKQCLARRRAQGRGVEARVLQPALGQLFEVRRMARAAEGAGGAVANVVDEDHQDVRCALGRAQIPDRRKLRVWILRIKCGQPVMLGIGNREIRSLNLVVRRHGVSCSSNARQFSPMCSNTPSRRAIGSTIYSCGTRRLRHRITRSTAPRITT